MAQFLTSSATLRTKIGSTSDLTTLSYNNMSSAATADNYAQLAILINALQEQGLSSVQRKMTRLVED